MTGSPLRVDLAPSIPRVAWLGWVYAVTILISAFLLFQVQPLISKFILPWFGGSPAVWTTSMLFFQVLLLGGYAYAHTVERLLGPAPQALLHVGLLGGALLLLPIAPHPSWKPADAADPTWRILRLLAVNVGAPYVMLSATGPLVQSWFSRSFPGRSPYRLYALSNLGSLAALLSYPFLVEPALSVGRQAGMWSGGFGLFAVLCGFCAWATWRWGQLPSRAQPQAADDPPTAPGVTQWLAWLLLPALASLALLATTNHVCQDVAVMPFLWVVPLSLYLLSFIIAFDHERWYRRGWYAPAVAVSAVGLSGLGQWHFSLGFFQELALCFGGLFFLCMLCHGELVRLRPAPRYLTSFYLAIAAGGALGGLFVSLVAPLLFATYLEWKITLTASFLLAMFWLARGHPQATSRVRGRPAWRWAVVGLATFAGLAAMAHAQAWFGRGLERNQLSRIYNEGYRCSVLVHSRNFYGVNTVLERQHATDPSLSDRALFSGQIPHGVQLTAPARRPQATTYYGPQTGVGRALTWFASRAQTRVGIIGLGAGTLAGYAQPGHQYRFYEINPAVERLAREHFWFLGDCAGELAVVLGDARLSLEREAPQRFHVLVLDAFSGDAVPTHLLSREAFEIYLRHLTDDGIIAVHTTNGYLNLRPVVRGAAAHAQLQALLLTTAGDDRQTRYRNDWMLLTRNTEFLQSLANAARPEEDEQPAILWTDDHSNLFQVLR